jgi:photosystem II stability/assembly factor-like uncharacterized protein
MLNQQVAESTGTVTGNSSARWKAVAVNLPQKENLRVVQFLDLKHGWTASDEGSLYKTTDGGLTWARVNIGNTKDAFVSGISFVDPLTGWIALGKTASNILNYRENEVWIMKTGDGGQNWEVQHNEHSVGLSRIVFVNNREGWAVGIKTTGLRPLHQVHYVLYTNDQGKSWTDVSGELNRIATDERGRVQDETTDVWAKTPSKATLLSLRGKVFETSNGGRNWQQVTALQDEPLQTCICRLGIADDGNLWVSGGTDGEEGIWGMLARKDSNNSWSRFKTDGVYFSDAAYLQNNQAIACGSAPSGKNLSSRSDHREGVILHSLDGGRNWEYIYRNAKVKTINALSLLDSTHAWAVGDDGLILRLEYSQQEH